MRRRFKLKRKKPGSVKKSEFLTYRELQRNNLAVKFNINIMTSLEERVLDFINNHPGGVRVSEMENLFGETRIKLGYVAKILLEKGMVHRVDLTYYPMIHSFN
jgi:hypothetical protein